MEKKKFPDRELIMESSLTFQILFNTKIKNKKSRKVLRKTKNKKRKSDLCAFAVEWYHSFKVNSLSKLTWKNWNKRQNKKKKLINNKRRKQKRKLQIFSFLCYQSFSFFTFSILLLLNFDSKTELWVTAAVIDYRKL